MTPISRKEAKATGLRAEWHIDHIIPVAAYKSGYATFDVVFHYLNLRPLWGKDNVDKSDTFDFRLAIGVKLAIQRAAPLPLMGVSR